MSPEYIIISEKEVNNVLGYQNDKDALAYYFGLCDEDYRPGTFTLNDISERSKFLLEPKKFNDWINEAINDELTLIKRYNGDIYNEDKGRDIVDRVIWYLENNRLHDKPLKEAIYYQEYSDIIRRLILFILINDPDFELYVYPELTSESRSIIYDVTDLLGENEKLGLKDWLHLSIAAGLLGIDRKPVHAATSPIDTSMSIRLPDKINYRPEDVKYIADRLIDYANSKCRIDATNSFFNLLDANKNNEFKIALITDDYLETIILLKFYEKLLEEYKKLIVYCIPRSIKCSNDASYNDILDFTEKIRGLKYNNRFIVIRDGPKLGGINLNKLTPNVLGIIKDSNIVDVRGARNYEMMQGMEKEAYFGYMVCRDISESVVGLPACNIPFVYLRHSAGDRSFSGFTDRYQRIENGKMLAKTAVIDKRSKWENKN